MVRERECDRRCASAAQAGVASSIVQKRPPIGGVATDDQTDEDGVVAAGDRRLLLALDVCHDAVQNDDPVLVLAIADAAKSVGLRSRKPPGQGLMLGRQDVEDEVRSLLHRGVHLVTVLDRNQDERRLERNGCERIGGHADRLTVRCSTRHYRDAGREPAEELTELRRLHAARFHRTSPASTAGASAARAGTQLPVARTSKSTSSGRRLMRPTTRSISAGQPTAMPINRSSNHLPANSRRRARAYCRKLAPVVRQSRIAAAASSAPRNAL